MKIIFLVIFLLLPAACTFKPLPQDEIPVGPVDGGPQIRPPATTSKAVISLIGKAREATQAGDLQSAETQLERALRIEPRNAVLWHYMARLRLNQDKLNQAAGLAAKSNSLERDDRRLQAANWRIIAHARYRGGDMQGAQQAQARADALLGE